MNIDPKRLLRDKKVIAEINRHKWLESEIAGFDIGYEAAAEDWLKKHAEAWVRYHQSASSKTSAVKSSKDISNKKKLS